MLEGLITKINSDTFTVKIKDKYIDTKARGLFRYKKIAPVVGDRVLLDTNKNIINDILPRKNYLNRPLVANIDIALIVTSVKSPTLGLNLLDKLITIISINKIEPVIIFTKLDLCDEKELKNISIIKEYYEKIGIKVFNNTEINSLKKYLSKKIITVTGQTGSGKSSLINKMDQSLNLETKEISAFLGRGVHTTRIVSLYEVEDFFIVDTPGFSSLALDGLDKESIRNSFIEFNNNCKYKDCMHVNEIGCIVKDDVKNGKIMASRYDNYLKFLEELK